MRRLEGKSALVTGAARGIGEAIARAFATAGAFVYLTDIDDERGTAVAAEIGAAATYRRLDVRSESDWQRVTAEIVDRHGRLAIVVNNAGITGFEEGMVAHDPEHAALADWHAVHRTNLDGVFLGCKYAIRTMRRTGTGSIINISSRSGLVGIPAAAAYASSKAAVRNHTKTVALYCAEQGLAVRCNSIHPAAILTPMWEPLIGPPGPEREVRLQEFVRDTPLRRFGTPEEVAAVALLLASDEAAYMTGSELTIDGGLLAGTAASPAGEQRPDVRNGFDRA
ncbi:glucose 1-dehydrogenase [Trichlorobacter ammonificans]|uniref:3-alpha-(Or 20-beta)-hydroxysteroid dehydrogenase n=1 Tax=Trichlorobacter ammonificans TaxID=2916410 RepID=A0ABM9DAK1_9BACT|nr:glucose 1-dehydrogenase [Trichlorobacter ammonificans]CAH2032268.1 3-alpha-(or 20-beta)-hydroxysteroid dehydrogenase [Trichlorobacter ammonificans]